MPDAAPAAIAPDAAEASTAAVSADLRFRKGRLRILIDGPGPIRSAIVNGVDVKPDAEGTLRLAKEFSGGTVILRTR